MSAWWCLCVSPSSLLLGTTHTDNVGSVQTLFLCLHSGVCVYHPHHCYCVQHTQTMQGLYKPCFCVCTVVSVCITLITVTVYNTHRQCRVCTNPVFVSAWWCLCVSPSSLLLCTTHTDNVGSVQTLFLCLHGGVCVYHPHHCYCVQHTQTM